MSLRCATGSLLLLLLTGCYVERDDGDDLDTGEPGAAFDVFIDVPGIGTQSNSVESVWRHGEVVGAACVPSTLAGFRKDYGTAGFRVSLAMTEVGATITASTDGTYPTIVEYYDEPVLSALQTGIVEVLESTGERLEVRIRDAVFCGRDGVSDCVTPDGPVMIAMEGPVTAHEGGTITQHPRLLDPLSGERLCTPLDLVR